jgi:hypothetical protein
MQYIFIQGDSSGKVNILGGGNIGHFEKKNHVANFEWLPKYSCLNLQIQSTENGNKERGITYC